jgi:hypothetical protein
MASCQTKAERGFALVGINWTIFREKDGVYTNGIERYESPEAALTSMELSN